MCVCVCICMDVYGHAWEHKRYMGSGLNKPTIPQVTGSAVWWCQRAVYSQIGKVPLQYRHAVPGDPRITAEVNVCVCVLLLFLTEMEVL